MLWKLDGHVLSRVFEFEVESQRTKLFNFTVTTSIYIYNGVPNGVWRCGIFILLLNFLHHVL